MTADVDDSVQTLRRRLFGSHLLVMAVALGVLLIGVIIVIALFEILGGHGGLGRGTDGGPFGLVFGLAAAVLASALVSWRVTKSLAEPLEKIGEATRELAAGRYDVRVPGADTVELNELATDVNRLASELETTEERRLRLIGDVAHELRNPLSTIEGTMEALLDGVVDAEPDTFARIGREAARLRRLADDLSSLSSAGELAVVASDSVDLVEVAAAVVAQLEPQASAKGLRLEFESTPVPPVTGDRDRLTQVLTNVIGNAVQYTDGTGVGLAIAKLIVEAHSGQITASSAGLDAGSTFRIELPAISAVV